MFPLVLVMIYNGNILKAILRYNSWSSIANIPICSMNTWSDCSARDIDKVVGERMADTNCLKL